MSLLNVAERLGYTYSSKEGIDEEFITKFKNHPIYRALLDAAASVSDAAIEKALKQFIEGDKADILQFKYTFLERRNGGYVHMQNERGVPRSGPCPIQVPHKVKDELIKIMSKLLKQFIPVRISAHRDRFQWFPDCGIGYRTANCSVVYRFYVHFKV